MSCRRPQLVPADGAKATMFMDCETCLRSPERSSVKATRKKMTTHMDTPFKNLIRSVSTERPRGVLCCRLLQYFGLWMTIGVCTRHVFTTTMDEVQQEEKTPSNCTLKNTRYADTSCASLYIMYSSCAFVCTTCAMVSCGH